MLNWSEVDSKNATEMKYSKNIPTTAMDPVLDWQLEWKEMVKSMVQIKRKVSRKIKKDANVGAWHN
jgi:hypothetical protein